MMLKQISLFISVLLISGLTANVLDAQENKRPNIVLLVSEDNSFHFMDHYWDGGAKTPNIESLAEGGITFDRVFSNSPVCSVARTTVINGVYAPRSATHHHRRMEFVHMPDGWQMFPYYLRRAGYFTVKNGKKDFNMIEADDPWKRYWGLVAATVFGQQAREFASHARELASDESLPVRIRAAEFLGVLDAEDPMPVLYEVISSATNEADALLALNAMTYLRDHLGYDVDPNRIRPSVEDDQIDRRLEHLR